MTFYFASAVSHDSYLWYQFFNVKLYISIGGLLFSNSNKIIYSFFLFINSSFFLFLKYFFQRKLPYNIDLIPYCLLIPKSFSLNTSAKTTSWICSSCLKICREKVLGILHPWLTTIISSACSYLLTSNNFWSKIKYSETVLILISHYVPITHFPLFFFRFFFLSTQYISLLACFILAPSFETSVSMSILFPSFCFLYFFACSGS